MQESSMRLDTNSSLWLMGDVTVVTVTLSRRYHKVLGHLFVFIPFHKFIQQNWPWRDREINSMRAGGACGGTVITNMHGELGSTRREEGRKGGGGWDGGAGRKMKMCSGPGLGGRRDDSAPSTHTLHLHHSC